MLWCVCFLNYADRQAISSVLPLLGRDFGLQALQLGLVASAFAWVYAGAAPVAGVLADHWPRKWLIVGACLGWSFFTLATAWCDNLWPLTGVRALTGLGEAFYFPAAMALLSDFHGGKTRSRALAWHQSAVYLGTILGSWLAAELAQRWGWRTPFRFFGPAGIVLAVVLWVGLREPVRGAADGAVTGQESRLAFRQAIREILRLPQVWLLMAAFACANFVAVIFLTWTPVFLVEKFQYSVSMAGLTGTVFIHSASAVSVLLAGWMADRLSRRAAAGRMSVQLAGLLAGTACILWVANAGTRMELIWAMVGFGACKGFYDSGIFASLYDCIEPRARGTAAGLMNMVGWGGGAAGPLFVGWMTTCGSQGSTLKNMSAAIADSAAWYALAALLLLGAWRVCRPAPLRVSDS